MGVQKSKVVSMHKYCRAYFRFRREKRFFLASRKFKAYKFLFNIGFLGLICF